MAKKEPTKRPAKPAGDANDRYNAGLRLMSSIEGSLRAGSLNDAETQVAKEAETELRAALELAPKLLEDAVGDHAGDPYLVVKLAACHDELGKPKEALRVLEAGLRATPGDPQMSAALAEVKEKLGVEPAPAADLPPAAKAMQEKAMKLGAALQKKMESIMNGSGSGEEKAKRAAEAQAEYQAAVMKLYKG